MFESKQNSKSIYSYLKSIRQFILGYISTYTANLIITPTQYQRLMKFISDHPHPNNSQFLGIIDLIPRMIAVQGWRSLWSGSLKNTNRFSLWQGLSFAFQDSINNFIINDQKYRETMTTFQRHFLSGMISGMLCCSLFYPIDMTSTMVYKLNSIASRKIEGHIVTFEQAMKNILQQQGFAGFYRHFSFAFFGTGMYRGLYFGTYYYLKSSENEGFLLKFKNGWISGFVSFTASYPFDAIRTAMWAAHNTPFKFKSGFDCFKKIAKERGFQGFYKGFFIRYGFGIKLALIISFYDVLASFMQQEHM